MLALVFATALHAAGIVYFPKCEHWTPRVAHVLRFATIYKERSTATRVLQQRLLCERCRPTPAPQTCLHPTLCVLSLPPRPRC